MKREKFSQMVRLAVLVGGGLALGCSKEISLAPVSGKVTVDDKPLSGGTVTLIPDVPPGNEGAKEASKMPTGGLSAGEIGSDGTYKIYTGGKQGAPPGKYKITVAPSMVPLPGAKDEKESPDLGFNKKYSDALHTPLHFEVVSSPTAGAYDLKLKK